MKDGNTTHLIIVTSDIADYVDEDSRDEAVNGSYTIEIYADETEARAAFKSWKKRTNMDLILVKVLDRASGKL